MVDARALEPFDLDGPVLSDARESVVRPAAAGGLEACAAALSRLLSRTMDEGLWWATIDLAEPHPNPGFAHLGPDDGGGLYTEVAGDYYLPDHARLDDDQLPIACRHTLLTLVAVYGFDEDDPLQVHFGPFT